MSIIEKKGQASLIPSTSETYNNIPETLKIFAKKKDWWKIDDLYIKSFYHWVHSEKLKNKKCHKNTKPQKPTKQLLSIN